MNYYAGVIGRNSLLCINFDRLDLKGDFIASKGIYLNNLGVRLQKRCGLDGNCGHFEAPSMIKIPWFWTNINFEVTFSFWFKRSRKRSGRIGMIYSNGGCDSTALEVCIDMVT